MQAYLETIACNFGRDPAICQGEEAIFLPSQKCPYNVTFDLDLSQSVEIWQSADKKISFFLDTVY